MLLNCSLTPEVPLEVPLILFVLCLSFPIKARYSAYLGMQHDHMETWKNLKDCTSFVSSSMKLFDGVNQIWEWICKCDSSLNQEDTFIYVPDFNYQQSWNEFMGIFNPMYLCPPNYIVENLS